MKRKNTSGYLILEVLISIVILSFVVLSLFSTISFVLVRTEKSRYDSEASVLMQEGIEVAYNILLSDWDRYASNTYYPAPDVSAGQWTLIAGTETNIKTRYSRSVTFSRVCRDDNGMMIPLSAGGICAAGSVDTKSRLVKAKVEWQETGKPKQIEAELLVYLP